MKGMRPPAEDGSGDVTRFGVYGFRPESSSEEESDDENVNSGAGLSHPGALFRPALPPPAASPQQLSPHGSVGLLGKGGPQPRGFRGKGCNVQFECFLHKRIRFANHLMEDAEKRPVCRPGMECP